jgi:hypothetical protein
MLCDIAGLSAVALGSVLAIWALTPFDVLGNSKIVCLITAPVLIGVALYTWYASKEVRNKDAEWWRNLTLITPFIGAISFTIDVFVGSTSGSYANFVQAGFHAGGPLGIPVTVSIFPATTIIGAGSWLRSSLLEHLLPKSQSDPSS